MVVVIRVSDVADNPNFVIDTELGEYHSILSLNDWSNTSGIVLATDGSFKHPEFERVIRFLAVSGIDLCFLSDYGDSSIAPRYLDNGNGVQQSLSDDIKIIKATNLGCFGGVYISSNYYQKLSNTSNNDELLLRISNDVETGSIVAGRTYPQILFCPVDKPHRSYKINVDKVGRFPGYPYTNYWPLLSLLFVMLVIVIIIVAICRNKKTDEE